MLRNHRKTPHLVMLRNVQERQWIHIWHRLNSQILPLLEGHLLPVHTTFGRLPSACLWITLQGHKRTYTPSHTHDTHGDHNTGSATTQTYRNNIKNQLTTYIKHILQNIILKILFDAYGRCYTEKQTSIAMQKFHKKPQQRTTQPKYASSNVTIQLAPVRWNDTKFWAAFSVKYLHHVNINHRPKF